MIENKILVTDGSVTSYENLFEKIDNLFSQVKREMFANFNMFIQTHETDVGPFVLSEEKDSVVRTCAEIFSDRNISKHKEDLISLGFLLLEKKEEWLQKRAGVKGSNLCPDCNCRKEDDPSCPCECHMEEFVRF